MGVRVIRLAVIPLVVLLMVSPVWASDSSITIDSVGGRKITNGEVKGALSGNVLVQGTSLLGSEGSAPPDQQKPLVADAGNSGFAAVGDPVTLLGTGYGGSAPYTFAWTSPVGTIDGADAPTAQLRTEGVAPGTYDITLTVTDTTGATASDTVKVVLYAPQQVTLLDETRADLTPGTVATGETIDFPFDVPANTARIDVHVTWDIVLNDYDLSLLDPSGAEVDSSGNGVPDNFEDAAATNPVAGTWTAEVIKFATATDNVHVTVTGIAGQPDPRPVVDAGGPYRFEIGATQTLTGTVTGGTAPISSGWDTDMDGVIDAEGTTVTATLPEGRHFVTFKATDAAGLETRETVSVLVATPDRLKAETTPITVVAINDTGINPYHLEFSATTYPDPDVLALTDNFTRHPSEYIPGYPADAPALPITHGKGYFPAEDSWIWTGETIKGGQLYWIPGTKIIGAYDTDASTGVTSSDDPHPILDDNGHGSGSASVSTGNRYGYCPTCVLLVVEGLNETVAAQYPWVDISSNSFGYIGGAPIGPIVGANEVTRAAAERGQTTLFAAGNGVGNAFDVPVSTYGSDQTGPDWNITVGAIRRDNERGIVGDGIPVHISAWGDGNLPSACRSGTVGQCAFGGTSAATPYTAGIFGTVLTEIRARIGDNAAGQKSGQVVAEGFALPDSPYLSDGKLTRAELREVVLKTAYPLNQANETTFPIYPYPLTAPYAGDINVLFEGYGAATPEGAKRAIDVLLGKADLVDRSFEDEFFELDRQIRDSLYGGYDRDGDGAIDSYALESLAGIDPLTIDTPEAAIALMQKTAALSAPLLPDQQAMGANAQRYYLHRVYAGDPGTTPVCGATVNEQLMDLDDTAGDLEPCFDNRVTSVLAAYRPIGIFASPVTLDAPLPVGSTVYVELYMAGETPSVIRPTGVLMATDREIGVGDATPAPVLGSGAGGTLCDDLGESCWTKYTFAFETTRPAMTGEHLTFQVRLLGARSWAFGHEGLHASRITIVPAEMPATGFEFGATIASPAAGESVPEGKVVAMGAYSFPDLGTTEAGDHPTTKRVEVSLNDPNFGSPIEATLDEASGTWGAPLGHLTAGSHTLYARARVDTTTSEVSSVTFTVEQTPVDARVEWQVVPAGSQPAADAWQPASGLVPYSFAIDTPAYGKGTFDIVVRLLENGQETATAKVTAKFTGN